MKNKKKPEAMTTITSTGLKNEELRIKESIAPPENKSFTSGECVEMMGEVREKYNNVYILDGRLYVSREVR